MTDRKIRIGVVGGGFGCDFQWHEHPNAVVEAVAEATPKRLSRLKQTYGCDKGYQTLQEMLEDDAVEAVALFTPAPDHAWHSIACLQAGKHVFSAVPATTTLKGAEQLLATVRDTGLTYMMAETSHYMQATISARRLYHEGVFGDMFHAEAEYYHPGLESLWFDEGQPTWRRGYPPMLYPTHCTALLTGVTGERLTSVTCVGWGDDSELLAGNAYKNPFWNETALFTTDRGHSFRVGVYWRGALRGCERAQWFGDKMSFYMTNPAGLPSTLVRVLDDGTTVAEPYEQPMWWKTEMLPEPLRHDSGHEGSHTFLTHEFISALLEQRKPTVDVQQALAYTVPGIIAHESALAGGKQMTIPQLSL